MSPSYDRVADPTPSVFDMHAGRSRADVKGVV
jgi:hypothetical protein